MEEYCEYSKYIDKGLEQYLYCSLTSQYCIKQKFCNKKNKVIHIDDWKQCTQLQRMENYNGQSNKK